MINYTILKQVDLPSKCYLLEVLYWRAFGRIPEIVYDDNGNDSRFSEDSLDSFAAPIYEPPVLHDRECQYAHLTRDPRMKARLDGKFFMDLDDYDKMLSLDVGQPPDSKWLADFTEERRAAVNYYLEVDPWRVGFEDYLDQFQMELCLKLRRGELVAHGRHLPGPHEKSKQEILDDPDRWLSQLDVVEVPKEAWIFETISWDDSAIYGNSQSYFWIHLSVEEMLRVFPPEVLLENKSVSVIGASYALVSIQLLLLERAILHLLAAQPCHGQSFTLKSHACSETMKCLRKKRQRLCNCKFGSKRYSTGTSVVPQLAKN